MIGMALKFLLKSYIHHLQSHFKGQKCDLAKPDSEGGMGNSPIGRGHENSENTIYHHQHFNYIRIDIIITSILKLKKSRRKEVK